MNGSMLKLSRVIPALSSQPVLPDGLLYQFVVAANGVFLHARRPELEAVLPARLWDGRGLPGLATLRPRARLTRGRLPARFLRDTQAATRAERVFRERLWIVRAADEDEMDGGPYVWLSPPQTRSAVRAQLIAPGPDYARAFAELHTHPPGCRRFSATDDADETGFRVYAIVCDAAGGTPAIRARVSIYGIARRDIPARQIFTLPPGWRDLAEEDGDD